MLNQTTLTFNQSTFAQFWQLDTLATLDQQFLQQLQQQDASLSQRLLEYRQATHTLSPVQISELLIASAKVLEHFIADLFKIQIDLEHSRQQLHAQSPILEFKKWLVLRRAKRRLREASPTESFTELDHWLQSQLTSEQTLTHLPTGDRELSVALLAKHYLTDPDTYAHQLEQLTRWCILALTTPEGQAAVQNWVSFKLPQPLDYRHLVSTIPVPPDHLGRVAGPLHERRQRQGFQLTDSRMSLREVLGEINYCIYCHDHAGDYCAKGFPASPKSTTATAGTTFKIDPLGNLLTGCPLEEKISEMHLLKREAFSIAALAVIMIDNPFCAVTGHRICNDCMKACIYQKQTPVNIPQIETRVLTDVLALPWGVEIYDLLIRWNPLRPGQWLPKPYNGLKILIAGQGPAGFTLAHHLLMEGFAVVGIDGAKIEPLPVALLTSPIRDYTSITESLADRIITGFGGVAEAGITVRWDKNFLKLIYLSLRRRPYYQIYGSVRFGGTLTVADAWDLGFDHLVIAVGAGLPQALPIPGSLAPGMRQAADFLMTLQLTGAAKANSLANLQIRLPAVVIGGGLTSIDAATEVQAYYLAQIEKIWQRYQQLSSVMSEAQILEGLEEESWAILQEWLNHGQALQTEITRAQAAGEVPNVQQLLHDWGGVTVVYRRALPESPAYLRNHEEISKALEEGIFYAAGLAPKAVQLDQYGHAQALVCYRYQPDSTGHWSSSAEEVTLSARCILVATGAQPNIAYEFEHRGQFQRAGLQYQPFHEVAGQWQPVTVANHCKVEDFGPFTSYQHLDHRVSFIGDTHPTFHGTVVKAVASGKRTYPHLVKLFGERVNLRGDWSEYLEFKTKLQHLLTATLEQVRRRTPTTIELLIRAPLVAKQFQPGQFFRVQNFETLAPLLGNTRLQTEALAMRCAGINREHGLITLMVLERGVSSRLYANFRTPQPIALMGPTGARTQIPAGGETILVIGGRLSLAEIRTLGPAFRAAGNRVLYVVSVPTAAEIYQQTELEAATDVIVWITASGEPISSQRPQDYSATGELVEILTRYANGTLTGVPPMIPLSAVTRVHIIGSNHLVKRLQTARHEELREYFTQSPQAPKFIAMVNSPMQCMLKGVCAQCLQWQLDPTTGQRTKAVFACSWQDQPLDLIDLANVEERLSQNRVQEYLSNLWLDYCYSNIH